MELQNSYKPLHYPDGWPDVKPEQISKLDRIPILNLLLRHIVGFTKRSFAYREIYKQLKERGSVPVEVWGKDQHRVQIAQILEKSAQKHVWCEDVYFFPEDSFDIVYNLSIGDLCEVEALMELEEVFQLNIRKDEQFIDLLYKAKMSKAVDLFLDRISYNPDKYKKYLEKAEPSSGVKSCFLKNIIAWILLIAVCIVLYYGVSRNNQR